MKSEKTCQFYLPVLYCDINCRALLARRALKRSMEVLMAGSSFGTIFRVTTWGESHGPALGAVVDGCPSGLPLSSEDFIAMMSRRRPGSSIMSTARSEADLVEILSGTFEGMTTGTPIMLLIKNTDHHSADYTEIADKYRPGHADFGFDVKYGIRDYRGGGRSSGRETAARCAAGVIAEKVLESAGISFVTEVESIGGIPYEESEDFIRHLRSEGDSCGSVVLCTVKGVPAGIGDPVFEKLDANLAKAVVSIGAVKSVDIGLGHQAAESRGSMFNDAFVSTGNGITTGTNNAGGILGGISTGNDIVIRAYFKPTPSISLHQETVRSDGTACGIDIRGRHDPVIGKRAAAVVESMAACTILDSMLINMSARLSSFRSFYGNK